MLSLNLPNRRLLATLTMVIFLSLMVVIFIQQSRIRALEENLAETPVTETVPNNRKAVAQGLRNDPTTAPRARQRDGDPLDKARQQHTEAVEKQLAEISAPLAADMASTMFNADIKKGQSLVTGGYQTADGRNQFTILKPSIISGSNGSKQIQIDSNLIAMSRNDTTQSGLDSLATNAKNTLQHAESWEESDVAGTMQMLQSSSDSEHLGQPKIVVAPGGDFTIQMTSDDQNSYTLSGTADLSPDGSGVVLKARIEQQEAGK